MIFVMNLDMLEFSRERLSGFLMFGKFGYLGWIYYDGFGYYWTFGLDTDYPLCELEIFFYDLQF